MEIETQRATNKKNDKRATRGSRERRGGRKSDEEVERATRGSRERRGGRESDEEVERAIARWRSRRRAFTF
jgi:hypothetical protein